MFALWGSVVQPIESAWPLGGQDGAWAIVPQVLGGSHCSVVPYFELLTLAVLAEQSSSEPRRSSSIAPICHAGAALKKADG